jgi:mono/diheme cytochrome c family protein
MKRLLLSGLAMLLLASLSASTCEPDPVPDVVTDTDELAGLPTGEAQRQALCARGRIDAVTAAFCADSAPDVDSLVQLQRLVGLEYDDDSRPEHGLTGHSSSLVMRDVSAINPRAVIFEFPEDRDDGAFMVMGYVRGDQLVEFAVMPEGGDVDGTIHFYLLRYEQACSTSSAGCSNADLLTPKTETGWTSYTLYDDVDLENTVVDCLQCHQPDGPGTRRLFRMQEKQNPWTHWFAGFTEGGRALFQDFRDVHGTDSYAGIPGSQLGNSNPVVVENLLIRSGSVEPQVFESPIIEDEVKAVSPLQPENNAVIGQSATWQLLYDRALAGEMIPPPFHDVKITDPTKLVQMSSAYVAFIEGRSSELPNIRDVIRDDALAAMSLVPAAGLDARGLLKHACAQCHNPRLNQDISRAKFNALDVDSLSDAQRSTIIERLTLPTAHRQHMPPHRFRDLSSEQRQTIVDFLRE